MFSKNLSKREVFVMLEFAEAREDNHVKYQNLKDIVCQYSAKDLADVWEVSEEFLVKIRKHIGAGTFEKMIGNFLCIC